MSLAVLINRAGHAWHAVYWELISPIGHISQLKGGVMNYDTKAEDEKVKRLLGIVLTSLKEVVESPI